MLDEPFGALDAFTREELWSVMENLWMTEAVHRYSRYPRSAGGRLSLRHRLCDELSVPAGSSTRQRWAFPGRASLQTTFEPHFIDIVQALRERISHEHILITDARRLQLIMPWAVTIGLFVVWEFACSLFAVPAFILPRPSLIFQAMRQYQEQIAQHSLHTLFTTVIGFALAVVGGMLIGLAVGASQLVYAAFIPSSSASTPFPTTGWCPLSLSGSVSAPFRR